MFKFTALFAALGLAVSASENYLIVFGDSLSDIGNIVNNTSPVPYYPGRFSNGPVWNEYLAHTNDFTLINYAIGGANSNNSFVECITGLNYTIPSALDQITLFNQTFGGKFPVNSTRNDVVVLEIGNNDFLKTVSDLALESIDLDRFADGIVQSVVDGVSMLHKIGYRKFVVTDIPDLTATPSVLSLPQNYSGNIDSYVTLTNKRLATQIAVLENTLKDDIDYIRTFELYKALDYITDNATAIALNITVTDKPCYEVVNNTLVSSCANSDKYVFVDSVHPSTKVHALIAAAVSETLDNKNFTITRSNLWSLIDSYEIRLVSSTNNWLYSNFTNKSELIITEYNIEESQAKSEQIIEAKSYVTNSTVAAAWTAPQFNRSAIKWESLLITDGDYFPECDTGIKWSDITMALSDTPNNKAPGSDGISGEVWKLVVSEKIPESKMAKIIFKIINIMYEAGEIPTNMDTSIVVPVPKKGDMKDPNWGLYKSPKIAVRIGDDVSKPTEYLCGLRQGCPASPILFDFYINDLFKNVQGVHVPGLTSRIPGLLFADDAVLLAESETEMQTSLNKITDWSNTWEMTVNASKCGVMNVAGPQSSDLILQGQKIPNT
ncbi:Thermolabile hemolysin, partial [Smittium mucronatum]